MLLIYVLGIISGIALLSIALISWIIASAYRIKDNNDQAPRTTSTPEGHTNNSVSPVAIHPAHLANRHTRTSSPAA